MSGYESYQFVKVEKENYLARVTLNRPEVLNAIHPPMHHELVRLWTDLSDDPDVRAILLTGAGRAFSAGGDIKWMAEQKWKQEHEKKEVFTASGGRRLVQNMLDVEQPIIGAINGDAMGLGATLALLCDVIVVSETARLADTHVKVGIVAGDGGAVIWPLLMGPARAKEFLMRGHRITGAEAGKMGMVNYAVPPDQVLPKATEIAMELAEGPTLAIRWSKLSVNKWLKEQVNLILDASLAYEMLTVFTEDHLEAARAFAEKRKPEFKGR